MVDVFDLMERNKMSPELNDLLRERFPNGFIVIGQTKETILMSHYGIEHNEMFKELQSYTTACVEKHIQDSADPQEWEV